MTDSKLIAAWLQHAIEFGQAFLGEYRIVNVSDDIPGKCRVELYTNQSAGWVDFTPDMFDKVTVVKRPGGYLA